MKNISIDAVGSIITQKVLSAIIWIQGGFHIVAIWSWILFFKNCIKTNSIKYPVLKSGTYSALITTFLNYFYIHNKTYQKQILPEKLEMWKSKIEKKMSSKQSKPKEKHNGQVFDMILYIFAPGALSEEKKQLATQNKSKK